MAETSNISWTDATFNPWIGCTRISPACDHCYAATWGARFGYQWDAEPVRTSASTWAKPVKWNREAAAAGERRFVFCASLADVFDKRAPDAARGDLYALIDTTPNLVWLLLTKRPQLITDGRRASVPDRWIYGGFPRNVWIGTTVENQVEHDRRIPELRDVGTDGSGGWVSRKFLSVEPLLGPVTLDLTNIDWVIVGGESGVGARPMHPAWVRSIRDQCEAAGVAFHFKQWGEWLPVSEIDDEFEETLYAPRSERHPEASRRCLVDTLVMHHDGTVFSSVTAPGAYEQGKGAMQFMRVGTKRSGRTIEGEVHNARPDPEEVEVPGPFDGWHAKG